MSKIVAKALAIGLMGSVVIGSAAHAVAFNDLFVFGDSYSDTGAFFPLTNGSTAVGYLAQDLGITLTTSKNPKPGSQGVNFAESGARVDIGPNPPATQPRSLTQQVAEFQNYLATGAVAFNSKSSLFFLLGGLNDHTKATQAQVGAATTSQIATLYADGARYFEIALLPSLVPAFTDSATNLNPEYISLIPQLRLQFPSASFTLSNWGPDFDNILKAPSQYGITNTTDACLAFGATTPCTTPNSYFYYYSAHPSDASHHIVGNELYQEALAIQAVPEPLSLTILATGLMGIGLVRGRKTR